MPKFKPPRWGSLQLRIVALMLLFTLGISAVITVMTARSLSAEWERSTLQNAEYALQTAASAIRRDVEEIDQLADWCSTNASVRTYLLTDYYSSTSQALSIYPTISAKYNSMRTLTYVQRFLLINAAGRKMMFGTAATNTTALTGEKLAQLGTPEQSWTLLLGDPLSLASQRSEVIPVVRELTLPGTSRTAHVYITVSPSLITTPLRDFVLADGAQLVWQMDGLLYKVENGALTAWCAADELPLADYTGQTLDSATQLYTTGSGDGEMIVVRYPVGAHGLYLLELIPTAQLQYRLSLMGSSLGVSLLAIAALGLALLLLLHHMIAHPIAALQRRMEKIGGGDFTPDPSIEWPNELGDIGRGINSMAASVTQLMDRRIEDEKQKQDLEYRMLQNQINPHFIYNTLNSIKWMATIQHAPGIAEVVTALSRLLKSVSKGNERLVPLYEEFALLNDYFTIQQYRFGGTITLDVSYIEDEALARKCRIPRFTLQPLVENAIFHGIEPKGSAGSVTLTVTREGSDVLLRLTDDGVGMTAAQAAKALQPPGPEEEAAKYRHVGMWNVHRRLQYSFGPQYGLSIESEPGRGTTVTVRLPEQPPAPPEKEETP